MSGAAKKKLSAVRVQCPWSESLEVVGLGNKGQRTALFNTRRAGKEHGQPSKGFGTVIPAWAGLSVEFDAKRNPSAGAAHWPDSG